MGFFFISIESNNVLSFDIRKFPSPMGFFFISIKNLHELWYRYNGVSVPYGVLFYFYRQGRFLQKVGEVYSFRPLWGSFLFLYAAPAIEPIIPGFTFPSPMGFFFISMMQFILYRNLPWSRFRPLWGSFLFLYCRKLDGNTVNTFVSVPYGVLFYFYPVLWKPHRA